MKIPTLSSPPAQYAASIGMAFEDLLTPSLRLGVTGLARSGKTVFITGLVRCLTEGAAVPAFASLYGLEGFRAYLEPQPDDDLPRFAYEEHLACLSGDRPEWPVSTKRISQLRLTLEWEAQDPVRSLLGLRQRLHIDIIDYPGEWLIDLAMLEQDFAAWSKEALRLAREDGVAKEAEAFLSFLDQPGQSASAGGDEQVAIAGAKLFTAYLREARANDPTRATLGPGRFLLPGELEGSPQLTFFPAPPADGGGQGGENGLGLSTSMRALLNRRYESYKANVVKPFFDAHFSRLDRQIVMIDALGAMNGGAEAVRELEHGLEGVLRAFRPGSRSWLSMIMPRRIEKIAFAATKADHIHCSSHRRLQSILSKGVARAGRRAEAKGAEFRCFAMAALKATQDVDTQAGGENYHCIRGVPRAGEKVAGRVFDGSKAAVVFPGDLPKDPLDVFDPAKTQANSYSFVRFQPPRRSFGDANEVGEAWPHIGLDEAFAFLFGDQLT